MSTDRRRIGWGIAATIAVLLGALAIGSRWSPNPLTAARRAYERGDWNRAADALRGEMRTERGSVIGPEVLRLYARTLVRLERDEAATAIYNKRLDPATLEPEDHFLQGLMNARAGRAERAFDLWEQARKGGFESPDLLDNLARLSLVTHQVDRAAQAARKLAQQPGWEARGSLLLAHIEEILDNPSGVVDACRSALALDPEAHGARYPASYYRRMWARNLLRLGRSQEAREQLEPLVANDQARIPSDRSTSGETNQAGSSEDRSLDREAYWLLSRAYLQQKNLRDAGDALVRSGTFRSENRLMFEPSPYVGSAACASCHAPVDRSYRVTRHARSFFHGKGLLGLPLPDRPLADPDDPKVTHTIERKDQHIEAQTRSGDRVFRLVVDYAFGTPERYVTMTGRDDQQVFRALRLSHYRAADGSGWDRTSGDVGSSDEADRIRGQPIDVRDGVVRCLYCHTTRSRDFRLPPPESGTGPEAADSGIGCERCHGPGGNHIIAIKQDFADWAIQSVGGAPAATVNAQCADCHIVGLSSHIERAPDDPKFVRSPGVTMKFSRCYTESQGGMSCLTCHDPHREAEHSAEFYEAKCLSCHSRRTAAPGPAPANRGAVCPVNPAKDCLDCHMPKVPMPSLHTNLTDHYIRVHPKDAPRDPSGPR
jgi:tetratricopeptide (TPR) repeat protein